MQVLQIVRTTIFAGLLCAVCFGVSTCGLFKGGGGGGHTIIVNPEPPYPIKQPRNVESVTGRFMSDMDELLNWDQRDWYRDYQRDYITVHPGSNLVGGGKYLLTMGGRSYYRGTQSYLDLNSWDNDYTYAIYGLTGFGEGHQITGIHFEFADLLKPNDNSRILIGLSHRDVFDNELTWFGVTPEDNKCTLSLDEIDSRLDDGCSYLLIGALDGAEVTIESISFGVSDPEAEDK